MPESAGDCCPTCLNPCRCFHPCHQNEADHGPNCFRPLTDGYDCDYPAYDDGCADIEIFLKLTTGLPRVSLFDNFLQIIEHPASRRVSFAGNSRLPMVAGWDNLLPAWFTRLHGRYQMPVNSIVFVGVATLGFGLLGIIGIGRQEAYQLLQNASGVFYALTYLVMFLIPLIGLRGVRPRPPLWLAIAAISGFGMTVLYIVVAVLPIVEVENKLSFTVKIIAVTIAANGIGAAIYLLSQRTRNLSRE